MTQSRTVLFSLTLMIILFLGQASFAQFDAQAFRSALKVKKNFYVSDGAISGGDRNSSDFRVENLKIGPNPGYDRIVIQLEGNETGEKATLNRPPFYLVEVNGPSKLLTVTLYGKPKLEFSSQTAIQAARKTKTIAKLNFIPLVNEDRWIWTIQTQGPVKAEVFELTNPARIVIDLKK